MATLLAVYNYALGHLGEEPLTTTTDPYQRRRELDNFYPLALSTSLEAGQWNFATRAAEFSSDGTPTIGFTYQFTKPTDWVRTTGFASDEYFDSPIMRYEDEAGVWKADIDPVYARWVSNHATLGGGLLSIWPASFEAFVAGKLAELACMRITQDKGLRDRLVNIDVPKLLRRALAQDAMNGPTRRRPKGSWLTSRGNNPIKYDRG